VDREERDGECLETELLFVQCSICERLLYLLLCWLLIEYNILCIYV
jgi:hypothetical protein